MKSKDSNSSCIVEITPVPQKQVLTPEVKEKIYDTALENAPELIGTAEKIIESVVHIAEKQQEKEVEEYKIKCKTVGEMVQTTGENLEKIPPEQRAEVMIHVTDKAFDKINTSPSFLDRLLSKLNIKLK